MRELEDNVKQQLLARGFIQIEDEKLLRGLLWRPDILLSLDGDIFPVEVKGNDSILPSYLNRIAAASTDKVLPLLIFASKVSAKTEQLILSLGISLGYFMNGRLSDLQIKKRRPKADVRKEVRRKLERIDIFVSSKQDVAERRFVYDRIEVLRKVSSFPFGPPILIEHDRFKLKELYSHIAELIDYCDWIVIVLEDEYSPVVGYEIRTAIEKMEHENVFMFVKETAACKTAWQTELELIRGLPDQTIKYLPYSNLTELEVDLAKAINKRMNEISEKEGIPIFVDD